MKKIIIPIIVVVIILLCLSYMRFVPHGYVEVDGYLFTSNRLVENLLNTDEDNQNLDYQKVAINDTIYQRGDNLFVGTEKKYQINVELPLIAKDSSLIMNFAENGNLIDSRFQKTTSYSNSIITGGHLYNTTTYEQADDDLYYFLELSNGVFINFLNLKISTITNNYEIISNSFLIFEENEIRYYSLEKGDFKYHVIQDIDNDSIFEINNNKFTYEELRILLELTSSKEDEKEELVLDKIDNVEDNVNIDNNDENINIGSQENTYVTPEVTVSDLSSSIYSLQATLNISDPAIRIKKYPTFELQIDGSVSLRKTISSNGNFEIVGLLPNTEYTIVGTFTYLNEDDVQVRKTFMEEKIRTKDISSVEPLEFSINNNTFYPNYISLTNIHLSNNSSDEVLKGLKTVRILIDDNVYNIPSSKVQSLKKLENIDYDTSKNLESNTNYTFRIVAYDVAGNELVVNNNTYQTKTSKAPPSIEVEVLDTDITTALIGFTVSNKDNVAMSNLRYVVSDLNGQVIINGTVNPNDNLSINNLDSNQVYLIEVYADYDLGDGTGVLKNQKLNQIRFSTESISSLGYFRFDFDEKEISQDLAQYTFTINSDLTDSRLIELLTRVEITVINEETSEDVITKKITGDSISLLQGGDALNLSFENLESNTSYLVNVESYIKQGNKEYNVETLTNLKNFKTLKKEAHVLLSNKFSTENMIDFDAKIVDEDGAIVSDSVRLEVRSSVGKLVYVDELEINDDFERLTLDKLDREETYTFTFTTAEYNIGYNNITFEENKVLLEEVIVTNVGIYGSLELDSLLRQTTSINLFDIENESRWKTSGSSSSFQRTVNTKTNTFTLTAKNASAIYSYYIPEYRGQVLQFSFYARYQKDSNNQKVFMNNTDSGSKYELEDLNYEWQKYEYTVILSGSYFSFNVNEISNNNTTTTVEIRELQVESLENSDKVNRTLSYHSSGYIFQDAEMISGKDSMPDYEGSSSMIGNYGDGYAKITNQDTGEVETFSYTGASQTFTAKKTASYKIELWGASGGDGYGYNTCGTNLYSKAGCGAYTAGTISLKEGTVLYVYVGGKGTYGSGSNRYGGRTGGFNGGGDGGNSSSGSGGGATDIRLVKTSNTEGLESRIMVAAGGGGADDGGSSVSNDGSGGAGGTLTSEGAYVSNSLNVDYAATQFSLNNTQLGIGKSVSTNTDSGGAGGGYFGGLASNNNNGGGAGGSSYISGYRGCIALTKDIPTISDYKSYKEKDNYKGLLYASVYDTKSELVESKFYIQIYKDGVLKSTDEYDMKEQRQSVNQLLEYEFERNSNYELHLCVKIRERLYTIAINAFSTEEEIRTIRTTDDFFAIHTNGKYLVANDLDFRNINKTLSINFSGTIDFQGHAIFLNVLNRPNYLFRTLSSNGKLSNLDVHYYFDNTSAKGNFYGLIYDQYGTVENIKITLEEATVQNNVIISLLCYVNRGTIRNFVLYSKVPLSGSYWLTLGCLHNYGFMENGYAYGEPINASFINVSNTNKRVGAIAGYSGENASYENIYSLVGVILTPGMDINNLNYSGGNLVGEVNRAGVKNVYSYVSSEEERDYNRDPNFGMVSSYLNAEDAYYASDNHTYNTNYSNKISKLALSNIEFQNNVLNSDNQFEVDSYVNLGYFPQLVWPSVMPNQDYIDLPYVEDDDLIDIITVDNVINDGEEATVNLTVSNPANERISDISIKDLTSKIVSQNTEDGITKLVIKVSDPTRYVSQYYIRSITSVSAYGIEFERTYEDNERALNIDMYKDVSSIADFKAIKNSRSENYRLTTDLDFKNATDFQLGNYSGKLNGDGHTISNITINSGESLITTLTGTVENLNVLNYTKTSKTTYGGLVSNASTNSRISNVHMNNVSINATTYIGGIAGIASSSTIVDCSVTNFTVNNVDGATEIRIGGLIGQISSVYVNNSYVQNIQLNLDTPDVVYATGGLIGQVSSGVVDSVYATGTIRTDFQETGGLVGRNSGYIRNAYTNVNIYSKQDLLGGIVGYSSNDNISNTLVVGDIYSYLLTTTNTHRTIGNRVAVNSNYAWDEQKINGVIDSEINGDILVTTDKLNTKGIYSLSIDIGEYFDDSNIGDNSLPLLYNSSKTELLPNQEASKLNFVSFEISNITISSGIESANILLEIDNPYEYIIKDLKIDGLKITDIRKNELIDKVSYLELEVVPERYYDSYMIEEIVYLDGTEEKNYAKSTKIALQFYKDIRNFEDWQSISQTTYENYRLVGDIDFAGRKNINTNVSINRLEGAGDGYTLKNLDLTFNSAGEALIKTVSANISNVNFENINIKNTGSGNYTGIIRFTMGIVSDVNFKDITIDAPNISYVGCFSSDRTISIRNISLENISVTGKNYTAGFIGRTRSNDMTYIDLKNVTVNSTGNYVAGMVAYRDYSDNSTVFHITADELNIKGKSYTGGIYGYGGASIVDVNNATVEGTSYVGGIIGQNGVRNLNNNMISNSNISGSSTNIGGIAGTNDNFTNFYVSNCEIRGTTTSASNVGGISGSGGWTPNTVGIWDSTVSSLGNSVGSVKGTLSYGSITRGFVRNVDVSGAYYGGGAIGKSQSVSNTISYFAVNANVTATSYGAGGIIGYIPNATTTSANNITRLDYNMVQSSTITAPYDVGGLIGRIQTNLYEGHFKSNLVVASVNSTMDGGNVGAVIGSGDRYSIGINNLGVYENTSVNNQPVKDNTTDLSTAKILSLDNLKVQSTYTNLGFSTSYFDYTPLDSDCYPTVKNVSNQENIPLPVETLMMFRRSLLTRYESPHVLPNVDIYASGIDTINIEFDKVDPMTEFTVSGVTTPINKRVYTLQYDFNSDLVLELNDGINQKTITKKALDLANLVIINDDNQYYYLKDNAIITNAKKVNGKYVNLYGNQALDIDGNIYSLDSGEIINNNFIMFNQVDSKPLYEFYYQGYTISTYAKFSLIGNTKEVDKQFFVKNDQLEIIDSSLENVKTTLLMDSYNDKNYVVVLGTDGVMYPLKEDVQYPDRFQNSNIKYISNNVLNNSSLLFVIYDDNDYICFDYRTGLVYAESDETKESLANYFISKLYSNRSVVLPSNSLKEYEKSEELVEKLDEKSITEVLTGVDKEEVTTNNYVTVYEPIRNTYVVYDITNYLENTLQMEEQEMTIEDSPIVDDQIRNNTKLQKYYEYQDSQSSNVNWLIIFFGILLLIILSLGILRIFLKKQVNKKTSNFN